MLVWRTHGKKRINIENPQAFSMGVTRSPDFELCSKNALVKTVRPSIRALGRAIQDDIFWWYRPLNDFMGDF